jgi:DNA-binding response OmpR family regulator
MAASAQLKKRPNTVLVVEDDHEMRELLSTELELEGLTVITANNGSEGVNKARTLKPDIILMDVMMPELTGIEATRMLKEDKETRHIPVIIVTSVDKKEDMLRGFDAGATDYITKPFFMPELKARVNAILRLRHIYDDIILVKDEVIKEQMVDKIRGTTSIIQETIEDNLTIIVNKLTKYQQKRQKITDSDLNLVDNAAKNIKNTITHLSSLDSLAFGVYQRLSGILDRNY